MFLARPRNSNFQLPAPGRPLFRSTPTARARPPAPLAAPPHLGEGGGVHETAARVRLGRGVVSRHGPKLLARNELQRCACFPAFLCADAPHPTRAPGVLPRTQASRAAATGPRDLWRPLRAAKGHSLGFTLISLLQARVAAKRDEKFKIIG